MARQRLLTKRLWTWGCQRLVLHRSFLRGLQGRGREVTGPDICRAALAAKLDCVADLAHTIHTTIQTAQRLLASAAALSQAGAAGSAVEQLVPAEMALERCRRRLLSISAAGLLGVTDPAASLSVIRAVSGRFLHPARAALVSCHVGSAAACACAVLPPVRGRAESLHGLLTVVCVPCVPRVRICANVRGNVGVGSRLSGAKQAAGRFAP